MPDVIILCGGAGLRLRSLVGDLPKAMANVAGRPFLELLIRQLRRYGFRRVVLAVGYGRELVRWHFGDGKFDVRIEYSAESSPLGTGGALRKALDLVESEYVLIMNGDSYTNADLAAFVAASLESKVDASMLVVPADGRDDCGTVLLDEKGALLRFEEKEDSPDAPHLNSGVYLMSRQLLHEIPLGTEVSLERELLGRWLREGKNIKGFVSDGRCIDIGTPERYCSAQKALADVEDCAAVTETWWQS